MHYKIKELHRLITILKSEEGLSESTEGNDANTVLPPVIYYSLLKQI